MKYSEKMQLLMKGVKLDEIKALEEQEAKEQEEATQKKKEEEAGLLEEAQKMIKDLEEKLSKKEAENKEFGIKLEELNNKLTQKDEPAKRTTGTEVFNELFNKKKGGN